MSSTQLLTNHNLFIATPSNIHLLSQSKTKVLFECETSGGIQNAKLARDNSSIIAVADNHLVILYDAGRDKDKKYRLKSGDGDPRLLLFAPSSRTLYFTTTLSHHIQAYSISNAELLPPLHTHPSPPNILAMSSRQDVLISASPTPPTIFIQHLGLPGSVPIGFFPSHTRSTVTCAAFRDAIETPLMSTCLFVLGFRDGSLALYRLSMPSPSYAAVHSGQRLTQTLQLRQPIKVGSITKLHKPALGGICAAEFISGYRARVVSIGHDEKCRIVDFQGGGEVLRTWRVDGMPTSLSAVSTGPTQSRARREKVAGRRSSGMDEEERVHERAETYITIGTRLGNVLIFNLLGLQVCEIAIGAPVIAMEWVGDMSSDLLLQNHFASSSFPATEEQSSPSPLFKDLLLDEYNKIGEEESGTVRKRRGVKCDGTPSPLHFTSNDCRFSSRSPLRSSSRVSTSLSRQPLESSFGSQGRAAKPPRKPYPRSRIVTETFTPPTSSLPTSPRCSYSPVNFKISDVRTGSQEHCAPEARLRTSSLRLAPDDSRSTVEAEDRRIERNESEIGPTLPASYHSRISSDVHRRQNPASSPQRCPTRRGTYCAGSPPIPKERPFSAES